ncbi:MAG TPA: hypothetical protein VHZ32_08915 [Rhizomicrobium sp.]|jgi:hypothetical protein|nr:hypothetical protein [Rhizomicrobium sp.]
MRRALSAIVALVLLTAVPARAAPTCQDRNGATMKCGTDGAMPVGWTLPPELMNRRIPGIADPEPRLLVETLLVIVLLFSLIALLPEFDGRRGADWGRPEDDLEDKG